MAPAPVDVPPILVVDTSVTDSPANSSAGQPSTFCETARLMPVESHTDACSRISLSFPPLQLGTQPGTASTESSVATNASAAADGKPKLSRISSLFRKPTFTLPRRFHSGLPPFSASAATNGPAKDTTAAPRSAPEPAKEAAPPKDAVVQPPALLRPSAAQVSRRETWYRPVSSATRTADRMRAFGETKKLCVRTEASSGSIFLEASFLWQCQFGSSVVKSSRTTLSRWGARTATVPTTWPYAAFRACCEPLNPNGLPLAPPENPKARSTLTEGAEEPARGLGAYPADPAAAAGHRRRLRHADDHTNRCAHNPTNCCVVGWVAGLTRKSCRECHCVKQHYATPLRQLAASTRTAILDADDLDGTPHACVAVHLGWTDIAPLIWVVHYYFILFFFWYFFICLF